MAKILILMGSPSDRIWCKRIADELKKFDIKSEMRISSAHKTPENLLDIIRDSNCDLIITVAGRSNALSGLVDGDTTKPVIACPPLDEQNIIFDIYSTVRMPQGVAPMLVLSPENAALAAAKIIGLRDEAIRRNVHKFQKAQQKRLIDADKELKNG